MGKSAQRIQRETEGYLKSIERLYPPEYRLTLLVRKTDEPVGTADILLTRDDRRRVAESIAHLIAKGRNITPQLEPIDIPAIPQPENAPQAVTVILEPGSKVWPGVGTK